MLVGFTAGTWDLLHAGHALFLADCRKHCDQLLVGLQTDPTIDRPNKNIPVQTIYERYVQLAYHKSVHHIIPYDTEEDLTNILATMDIDIRFLGSDYLNKSEYTGKDICENRNIKIMYVDRLHNWSSSYLRMRVKSE